MRINITNSLVKCMFLIMMISILSSQNTTAYNISYYSADYNLIEDVTLVTIRLDLKQTANDFTWRLPEDASGIQSNTSFRVKSFKDYKEISTNSSLKEITFTYLTSTHVEKNDDNYFLLDFSQIQYDRASIILRLPENANLKYSLESQKSSIIPKTSNVLSDGQRIIIRWTETDFKTSKALLVIYELNENNNLKYLILGGMLFMVLTGALYFISLKDKNFSKQKITKLNNQQESNLLTRNLFEEEKLIIEELLKEKTNEMWQKSLQLKTKLTKVKLSRKLRSLEAKGLIERIPYGNTKKIRLKK